MNEWVNDYDGVGLKWEEAASILGRQVTNDLSLRVYFCHKAVGPYYAPRLKR